MRVVRIAVGFLCALIAGAATAQTVTGDYRLTISNAPVARAIVWLYFENRGGLPEPYKIADVSNGWLHIALSSQEVLDHDPLPGSSSLLLVVEVPDAGLYSAGDIGELSKLDRALESLGTTTVSGGARTIDLAPAVPQTLRLENPDGTPRVLQQASIWSYATLLGHCARPDGIGAIDVTTDAGGIARFRAPRGRLFLLAEHYAGERMWWHELQPGIEHVVRARWEKRPERDFVFRIRRPDGTPARTMVFADGDGCDVSFRELGQTDAKGDVVAHYSPDEGFSGIWIGADFDDRRVYLSPEQYRELDRTSGVNIIWPLDAKQ